MKDVVRRGTAAGSVGSQFHLSGRRQDRHDERRHRRLVHRLHVRSRRRRVDGLRQAAEDQGERAGRRARRAGVDGVHERGLPAQAGAARLAAARRHRHSVRSTSRRTCSGLRAAAVCKRRSTSSPAPSRLEVCAVQLLPDTIRRCTLIRRTLGAAAPQLERSRRIHLPAPWSCLRCPRARAARQPRARFAAARSLVFPRTAHATLGRDASRHDAAVRYSALDADASG